jgi:uncharacterized protein (DUF305 family)
MRTPKITMLLAGLATAVAVLAGCGAPADGAAPGHNAADVQFAQGMIPHHRQAVEMTELVAGRTRNPAVVDLAARIGAAQGPEIDTMTGWLQEWGAEMPAAGMSGMDHGGDMTAMDGMMTPEQMGRLEQADGPAFDRLFLEQMIEHHAGAVDMAGVELEQGADPDALALARTIVDTQQAEIDEMAALLEQG